jgi:hypothetical protein
MSCLLIARAIIPLTAQPLLSLSLLSLSFPKLADDFSSTIENCTDRGGPASSPLPRIIIGEAVPCIVGAQASGRISTATCKMLVSTLNPHLVQSISLLTVHRPALLHMHSSSARFRVRSQYSSARVFSPFSVPMMATICAQLLGLGFDLSIACVVVRSNADDEHHLLDLFR